MTKLILAACATSFVLLLSACTSTGDKYYQHDGPPSPSAELDTRSVSPKVEHFYPASLRPYTVMGQRYTPVTTDAAMSQTGTASWYGKQFHGNKTAIGEIYNMHAMTAAHPTMPLPSYARVTNLENGRAVIVRVNDRGPFLHNRIIDLSYAAASALDYANKGTARVRVERLTNQSITAGTWQTDVPDDATTSAPPTPTQPLVANVIPNPAGKWSVQIGFFNDRENARATAAHAEAVLAAHSKPQSARVISDNGGYRVVVGQNMTLNQAHSCASDVKDALGSSAFVVQK